MPMLKHNTAVLGVVTIVVCLSRIMSCHVMSHPLHALVLVVGCLLDAVGMVLEGGVAPGVVLLLFSQDSPNSTFFHGRKEEGKHTKNAKIDAGQGNIRNRVPGKGGHKGGEGKQPETIGQSLFRARPVCNHSSR